MPFLRRYCKRLRLLEDHPALQDDVIVHWWLDAFAAEMREDIKAFALSVEVLTDLTSQHISELLGFGTRSGFNNVKSKGSINVEKLQRLLALHPNPDSFPSPSERVVRANMRVMRQLNETVGFEDLPCEINRTIYQYILEASRLKHCLHLSSQSPLAQQEILVEVEATATTALAEKNLATKPLKRTDVVEIVDFWAPAFVICQQSLKNFQASRDNEED